MRAPFVLLHTCTFKRSALHEAYRSAPAERGPVHPKPPSVTLAAGRITRTHRNTDRTRARAHTHIHTPKLRKCCTWAQESSESHGPAAQQRETLKNRITTCLLLLLVLLRSAADRAVLLEQHFREFLLVLFQPIASHEHGRECIRHNDTRRVCSQNATSSQGEETRRDWLQADRQASQWLSGTHLRSPLRRDSRSFSAPRCAQSPVDRCISSRTAYTCNARQIQCWSSTLRRSGSKCSGCRNNSRCVVLRCVVLDTAPERLVDRWALTAWFVLPSS